jgi:coenzyme F420-reducing hydrogenase alpha subunit
MKKLAGDLCAAICGRHTHPIAMTVGGFTHYPSRSDLESLRERLAALRADVDATVELFQKLRLPDFERETEYLALRKPEEYCFIDGEIASSDGGSWPVERYREITSEYLVAYSSAKRTKHQREAYMVGALARFNISFDRLHPRAKAAASALGIRPKCTNPYLNTAAQVVEIVHCVEDAARILDQLLAQGIAWEEPAKPTRLSGEGVGACDVPRGTLYHNYRIEDGKIAAANCIIPTGQNLANIEADMRALVPKILSRKPEEITLALEMLVRAYDPCISCSTHMLEVRFV